VSLTTFYRGLIPALLFYILAANLVHAADDGSQMDASFRINYAGYLPEADKLALYLSPNTGAVRWSVSGTNCSGSENTYVTNDFSSGDSFYKIDFSKCTTKGQNLRLVVNGEQSPPFDISDDPYGNIKYEFFDYFKDHESFATFNNTKNDWQRGLSLSFNYVRDAGDNGAYPVNTAEAAWSLINLLETYPGINTYYSRNFAGARTVYDQLKILTEQFNHILSHNRRLAIPKLHANVNGSWAACLPHTGGSCISEPETKATYATARTLAAMARLHQKYGNGSEANDAYQRAKTALNNARSERLTCNQADKFGGEGGMYPDNDNTSIYRDPKTFRDNCVGHRDNTEDDQYAALVENYLAARALGNQGDANNLEQQVTRHPRFNEASSFWWGAVVMEGNLSLLTNESKHSIDLSRFKTNLMKKADEIKRNQAFGYPGVTWDPFSNQWDSGDQDNVDNNVRWGSNRMALNDARILMAASEVAQSQGSLSKAADYARSAIQVLDHMSGLNAVNLAMYTAKGYNHIENAVERTHDGADGADQWAGKMVLGPNNWTNADDPNMPQFGSEPGLKMFPLQGSGWAAREISIDANAALMPVAYFTTEVAPFILVQSPQNGGQAQPSEYRIIITDSPNGSISPGTTRIGRNQSKTFSIQANQGYEIESVIKSGVNVGAVNSVTFSNVNGNQSLRATFRQSSQDPEAAGSVSLWLFCAIWLLGIFCRGRLLGP